MNAARRGCTLVRRRPSAAAGERLLVTVGTDVVRAEGVLDEFTVDLLLAAAEFVFTRGSRSVTLDLTGTRSIDSAAIRELFHAQTGMDASLSLHLSVPPHLRPRLAICRLDGPSPLSGSTGGTHAAGTSRFDDAARPQ